MEGFIALHLLSDCTRPCVRTTISTYFTSATTTTRVRWRCAATLMHVDIFAFGPVNNEEKYERPWRAAPAQWDGHLHTIFSGQIFMFRFLSPANDSYAERVCGWLSNATMT